MQKSNCTSPSSPLFKHHDVGLFGEHGRHNTKCMIERAVALIKHNHTPIHERYKTILNDLNDYPSQHGIPESLITTVYTLCLDEITNNFTKDHFNPVEDEFYIACDVINLITHKFHEKVCLQNEDLRENFSHFSKMIPGYNATGKRRENQLSEKAHETFFRIMHAHVKSEVEQSQHKPLSENKNLAQLFHSYHTFIKIKLNALSKQPGYMGRYFCGIFQNLISFINTFKSNIHTENGIFKETTDFVIDLVKHYPFYLQCDSQATINELVISCLDPNCDDRTHLTKNMDIADKLKEIVEEKEPFILVKMEQILRSKSRLEASQFEDFKKFISIYHFLFLKCPEDFQLQTLDRISKNSERITSFLFLVEKIIPYGVSYKHQNFNQYIKILKNLVAKSTVYFKSKPVSLNGILFDFHYHIAVETFHAMIHMEHKRGELLEVTHLGKWLVDLAVIIIMTPGLDKHKHDEILECLISFIKSHKDNRAILTTETLKELRQISIAHQTEKELVDLTKITSSVLSYREETAKGHGYEMPHPQPTVP